jgi:galactokinase
MSLRFDYEVTGKELDTIVDRALIQPGCLGARMTGAGFGGCAIALVEDERLDTFQRNVGEQYAEFAHLEADFISSKPEQGVRCIA